LAKGRRVKLKEALQALYYLLHGKAIGGAIGPASANELLDFQRRSLG
jgi:hypothetical protein